MWTNHVNRMMLAHIMMKVPLLMAARAVLGGEGGKFGRGNGIRSVSVSQEVVNFRKGGFGGIVLAGDFKVAGLAGAFSVNEH